MNQPPDELRARLEAAIAKRPSANRASYAKRRALVVLAAAALALGLVALTGGVHHGGRTPLLLWGVVGGWALVVAGAASVALGRRSMIGPPTAVLAGLAAGLAPVLLGWFVLVHEVIAPPALPEPSLSLAAHVGCLVMTVALSFGPVVAFAILRRGSDATHPRATGAVLGGLAGGIGSVLIDVHCPVGELGHVALGHVVPVALLVAVGALFGRRLFGVRG